MPLILSVKKGDDIFIDDNRVVVSEIGGDGDVSVVANGKPVALGDDKMTEVFPDVLISAGLLGNNPRFVRLIIKAPRRMEILRGDRYRQEHKNAS